MSQKSNTSQMSCRLINFTKKKNIQNEEQSQISNDHNLIISRRIYHKLDDNVGSKSATRAFAKSSQGYRYQKQYQQNKKTMKLKISMITFSSVSDHVKAEKSQEIQRQTRQINEATPRSSSNKTKFFSLETKFEKLHSSLRLRKKSPNNVYISGQSNQQSQSIQYVPTQIFPNRKNSSILRSRFSCLSSSKSPSHRQINDKSQAKQALMQYVPKKIQNRRVNEKSKFQRNNNFQRNVRISMPIDFKKFPRQDNLIQQLKFIHL